MIHRRLDARMLKTRDNYIAKLKDMGVKSIEDLLMYFPRTYRDEQNFTKINEARTDETNVISGTVKSIISTRTRTGKNMVRAVVADETGEIPVMWFNQAHVKQMFFKGSPIILTGKIKFERGKVSMLSPKYERPSNELIHTGRIVPVYPESESITSQWLRGKIYSLLSYIDYIEDVMPEWILEREELIPLQQAIKWIHFPENESQLKKARRRLAFDELFILQFQALKRKYLWQKGFESESNSVNTDLSAFFNILPFVLTSAQQRVIEEITQDLQKKHPMMRLIQGDVGAGKTVVAAAAIYLICKERRQAALMAPTEILARQHFKGLLKLLSNFNLNIQLLVGSTPATERDDILRQLASGTCDLIIGTHSLIQDGITFSDLALAVIDEQHRFGVKQRERLQAHGHPHLLSLSATPIPRTLALTLYGDQDLSLLDELPPGRQEIVTRLVPEQKRGDANTWVSDQIRKGRQVFVICPLVEESEAIQVKSATEEYDRLCTDVFPEFKLALLHGRMKAKDKDETMKLFSDGKVDILVSTSVVEVGIDVPNASIMIIEGADRFGLAQLHQFRGRVGRGEHQSYCFLFSDSNSPEALQRLKNMVKYSSGFDLAEIDLAMRGPGEVYGVKQSGIPDLKMASLSDSELIASARRRAQELVEQDVHLGNYKNLRKKIQNYSETE